MIRLYQKFSVFFVSLCVLCGYAADADQQYVDGLIRDVFANQALSYTPLHGGSMAQVARVSIEPATCVVRKIRAQNSFEQCVQECVVARLCAAQKIGPLVYTCNPTNKIVILEYIQDKGVPRDKIGTKQLLHEFGTLMGIYHAIEVKQIEAYAQKDYNCALTVGNCYLFALRNITEKIQGAGDQLTIMGLTAVEVQQWAAELDQRLRTLFDEYGAKNVFSHGDLHWGNYLYAKDRLWFIDYEMSGLAPWWYDLGVLGAHYSFTEESDNFLLEAYFGTRSDLISAHDKAQYACMKNIAVLFYATLRLSRFSLELVQQAVEINADLVTLQEAYRNGSFSLNSDFAHAQLAIAMIRSVEHGYKQVISA